MHRKSILILAFACLSMFPGQSLPAQTLWQKALERFDTDGDGRLSDSERQAVRDLLQHRSRDDVNLADAQHRTWQIGDLKREALIFPPKQPTDAPLAVVFGFHGHGGSAINAARSFQFHQQWPEALVIYMQGVPTPGRLTDPQGKRNGWQHGAGDQEDRDLKFFDAVLASVRKDYRVDDHRIYASGHSNGGAFTYLLWAERPDTFAAFAPSASAAAQSIRKLTPKPAMHIAGKNDNLVRFSWQERTIQAVLRINGCESTGKPWAEDCTQYASAGGTPFVAFIHDGTHKYPSAAPALIVKFFQQQKKP